MPRKLTTLEVRASPRPPHKLLDALPRPFEPRDRFRRVTSFDLFPPPNTQRVISTLREREDAFAERKEPGAPDRRRGLDSEEGSAGVVERPGLWERITLSCSRRLQTDARTLNDLSRLHVMSFLESLRDQSMPSVSS